MNSDVEYIKSFYRESWANHYFDYLYKNVKWADELKTVDGSTKKIKRKMAYFYDRKVDYKYANFILPGEVWINELEEIKELIEYLSFGKYNSVLLNLYEDGKDEIKWHSDKEPQLGENPVIAMLNLGATRTFHMINKETGEKQAWPLSNGDLFIMGADCQKNWLHAILPEKDVTGPRISLTFRWVYDDWIS